MLDKTNKISFKSLTTPSWNKEIEYHSILTQAKMIEMTDWLIEKGGKGVICTDPLRCKPIPENFEDLEVESLIPIDLGYYSNDELLGYVSAVLADGYFVFSPTDELRKQYEDSIEDE